MKNSAAATLVIVRIFTCITQQCTQAGSISVHLRIKCILQATSDSNVVKTRNLCYFVKEGTVKSTLPVITQTTKT